MIGQKSKEDYHLEAAQYINTAQKAISESGEQSSSTELAFLTRGAFPAHLRKKQ
jgi:hypothetical protein